MTGPYRPYSRPYKINLVPIDPITRTYQIDKVPIDPSSGHNYNYYSIIH